MDSQIIEEAARISLTAISIVFLVITSLLITIKFANYVDSKSFLGSNDTQNCDAAKAAAIAVVAIKYSKKIKSGS